jgi:hypothetical protein
VRYVDSALVERRAGEIAGELQQLEDAGVIQLSADRSRFTVLGGRPASVLLKYEARADKGPMASDLPFDLSFMLAVGRALIRDVFTTTLDVLDGARSLGFGLSEGRTVGARRSSPRRAVSAADRERDLTAIARGDLTLIPWGREEAERISELLADSDNRALALVSAGLADERGQLEYVELWELGPGTEPHELTQQLAEAVDALRPVVNLAGLRWLGAEDAVLQGDLARATLVLLQPPAALRAVSVLFRRFMAGDSETLAGATALADAAIADMRTYRLPRWQQQFFLSTLLSNAGFLKAFDDSRLDEARRDLEDARECGVADVWVTDWNLANIAARQRRYRDALGHLARVGERVADWEGDDAAVVFFVPGVRAADGLISVGSAATEAILSLQRAVVDMALSGDVPDSFEPAVNACRALDNAGASQAADLAVQALEHARAAL